MLIYLLVAPGKSTDTPRGYVGSTEHPRSRLLAHARKPVAKMAKWLKRHNYTMDDVMYTPLQCVPSAARDDAESRWSLRLGTHDGKGFNAFGTYGNPTRERRFWQRRHITQHSPMPHAPTVGQADSVSDHVDVEVDKPAKGSHGGSIATQSDIIEICDENNDELITPVPATVEETTVGEGYLDNLTLIV